jgi:hypothetical protein
LPAYAGPLATGDKIPVMSLASGRGADADANQLPGGLTGRYRIPTIGGNLGTLSSLGTSTTPVAGTTYFADIYVPFPMLVTGVGILNGGTVGTNNWIVALYAAVGGSALANSALAGTLTAGANAFQQIPFAGTYQITTPGRFWIGGQLDGTTDRFRSIATGTWIDVLTKSAAGSFGTLPPLTLPTTFTADVGPIAYIY